MRLIGILGGYLLVQKQSKRNSELGPVALVPNYSLVRQCSIPELLVEGL